MKKEFVVKCEFPATAIWLRVKAKDVEDAIEVARRDKTGRKAETWKVIDADEYC